MQPCLPVAQSEVGKCDSDHVTAAQGRRMKPFPRGPGLMEAYIVWQGAVGLPQRKIELWGW